MGTLELEVMACHAPALQRLCMCLVDNPFSQCWLSALAKKWITLKFVKEKCVAIPLTSEKCHHEDSHLGPLGQNWFSTPALFIVAANKF